MLSITSKEWGIVILAFCNSIFKKDCNYKVLINANKLGFYIWNLKCSSEV